MNKIAVVGVALLFLVQVHSHQGDAIKSIFEEKVKELKEKQPEPFILLAATTPAPPAYPCNVNDVIANTTQLIENTLDIFQKTFSVGYTAWFAGRSPSSCNRGAFACFLLEYTTVKNNIDNVYQLVSGYQAKAKDLLHNINDYRTNCIGTK